MQGASAFMADVGLDALCLSSTRARRLLWWQTWNVGLASKFNFASAPFAGGKLFKDQRARGV